MTDLKAIFQTLGAACQGQLTLSVAADSLESLQAYAGSGRDNPIARYSQSIVDALPKVFRRQAGMDLMIDQLQQKLSNHSLLLQTLSDAGALVKLHPSALRYLFEDGQKTRSLLSLLLFESTFNEEQQSTIAVLKEILKATGHECGSHVRIANDASIDDLTYFFSAPTVTASAFFGEVANRIENDLSRVAGVAKKLEAISTVVKALELMLNESQEQRETQQQYHSSAFHAAVAGIDKPEWIAESDVRKALVKVASSLIKLVSQAHEERLREFFSEAMKNLFTVADRCLNAYAAALAAIRGLERLALAEDYSNARDNLLDPLLSFTLQAFEDGSAYAQGWLIKIESIAESHNGYKQLFDVCDFTNDRVQLQKYMRSLSGDDLAIPMKTYVFSRLLAEKRNSEILTFAAEFDNDLAAWLRSENDVGEKLRLRWLHDIGREDFEAAAGSLTELNDASTGADDASYLSAMQKLAASSARDDWPFAAAFSS